MAEPLHIPKLYHFSFPANQLTCSNCTSTVKTAIERVPGVIPGSVVVSFLKASAEVKATAEASAIIKAIEEAGYEATESSAAEDETSSPFDFSHKPNPRKYLWRSLVPACFGIPLIILEILSLIPGPTMLLGQLILAAIAITSAAVMVYSGWDIYRDAWRKGLKAQTNMNTLVTLGSVLALAYSILLIAAPMALPMLPGMHMALCAGVLVLAIVNFGSYLKERAQQTAISHLPDMRSLYLRLQARTALKVDNTSGANSREIKFSEVKKGDYILVEAGHYFPVDGTIVSADADILIDERTLTGEKTAKAYHTGSKVLSGTLFTSASSKQQVIIQADCDGTASSFHQMMSKIAQTIGTEAENTSINRFLKYFTPSVLAIAVIAALLWFFLAPISSMSIVVFISVLLCACPCALGLAAPMAYSTAVNKAFKHNIMIRSADALDALAQIKSMAFDMTGTLTEGEMELAFRPDAIDENILQLIASLESKSDSTHPIASAILRANKLPLKPVSEPLLDSKKRGISGEVAGRRILIGSIAFLEENGITIPENFKSEVIEQAKKLSLKKYLISSAFVAVDGHAIGYLLSKQKLRAGANETIQALKAQGIKTILLTGAQNGMAELAKKELGMDEVKAEQTPESKKIYLESLKQAVGFLGDDPNDFPALSAPRVVGLSIHPQAPAAGLAAINLSGSVKDLIKVIEIAKLTRRNIHFSLAFMVLYNLVSIALAAGLFFLISGVLLNPILASVLMGLSSLTVVLTGMSLNYFIEKKFSPKQSFTQKISHYWRNTSHLNKFIQISLSLFSLLLLSTVITNLSFGFSWFVIFNSMILACTCCTGIVGILSAVGLMGIGLSLIIIGARSLYHYVQKNTNSPPPSPPSAKRSITDTHTGSSTSSSAKSVMANNNKRTCSAYLCSLFSPRNYLPISSADDSTANLAPKLTS